MNGAEVLRVVDTIHRDKNIDKEIVFLGIEQAILSAARKHFGEEYELTADIDRDSGEPTVKCDGEDLEPEVLGDLLGRIAAQTAKQVMIQKIREAERDALFEEYSEMKGYIVTGTISRFDGGSAIVSLGKVDGFLPRSEQISGESHRMGERVRAVVIDVRKAGSRVKIILSRTHPELVLRLFEIEIPEVAERVIEVRSLAREAGYRSKVAVSCYDTKIDCVGACVGVRGSRIKNIVDELAGERIDIVRWNDSLQVLVPNSMQPAEVEDVILCPMLGRVIVLVREDQLSLAIGKRGQNVRLASKLVGWDIEVMTRDELDEQIDKSVEAFSEVPGVNEELAENLVVQGFFSFYDLSVIEPDQLAELGELTAEQCDIIVEYADEASERQDAEEAQAKAAKTGVEAAPANSVSAPPADSVSAPPSVEAPPEADPVANDVSSAPVEEAPAAESVDEAPQAEVTEEPVAEEVDDEAPATEEAEAEQSDNAETEELAANSEDDSTPETTESSTDDENNEADEEASESEAVNEEAGAGNEPAEATANEVES